MRRLLMGLFALLLATPVAAQTYTNLLPVTCRPGGQGPCITSIAVVNPDGTFVSGGGGGGGSATAANQEIEIARLTSILSGQATSTNQTTLQSSIGSLVSPAAGSALASLKIIADQAVSTTPVTTAPPPSATTARTNVTGAATSTLLLATNANRLGCSIVNDSAAILYLGLSTGVSATSYEYVIDAKTTVGGSFECPFGWTGPVYGIWASATGAARVGERTQ